MHLIPGQLYQLRLSLRHAAAVHPVWLVGALGASYPGLEVVSLDHATASSAGALVRARVPLSLDAADTVRGLAEGLPSELPLPEASVEAVEPVLSSGALDVSPPQAVTAADLLRLGLAAALIGVVAYANYRIGVKHERAARAA